MKLEIQRTPQEEQLWQEKNCKNICCSDRKVYKPRKSLEKLPESSFVGRAFLDIDNDDESIYSDQEQDVF